MSILDKAISEEKRAEFLQYRLSKHRDTPEEYEQMAAYISGPQCVRDLEKLKHGEYSMDAPFHFRIPKNFSGRKRDIYAWKGPVKFLFSLLTYVIRDYDGIYSEGLYSFRVTKTAKDFLLKLRGFHHTEDYYIQNAIRYVYWGSFSKKRYRTRYTDLKRMGYRSLVHSYYHSTQRPNAAADA